MEHSNSIIMYLGGKLKVLIKSVLLKFFFYMTLLTFSLLVFFSVNIFESKLYFIIILFFVINTLSFLADHKLFFKYTNILLKDYLFYLNKETNRGMMTTNDIHRFNVVRKESDKTLKMMGLTIIPKKFSDCFALLLKTYPNKNLDELSVKNFYVNHLKQIVLEWIISISVSSPFFIISILLTIGYNPMILTLSLIMAFVFFLFIKSSIISVFFYLLTMKKMKEVLFT